MIVVDTKIHYLSADSTPLCRTDASSMDGQDEEEQGGEGNVPGSASQDL
jgi:hypothetical protein